MTDFQPTPQTPEEVSDGLRDAMKQAKIDGVFDWGAETARIYQPKQSNWKCYMFGGDDRFSPITWVPEKGRVPNAWVRFWMKVFLDCNWVKK